MIRQLREGLILRSVAEGIQSDRDNLGHFYKEVFGSEGEEDAVGMPYWVDELLADAHPTMTPDDFWMVVDPTRDDKIVSAVLMIPQTWHYEDIPIDVGRVELVATDKDYRQRGLVRELMHAAHERSAALGHHLQSITGIPHYYRRFGYSMTVDLGSGSQLAFEDIPELKNGESPKFTLRTAVDSDIENLIRWTASQGEKYLLWHPYTAEMWRFEINHRHPKSTLAPTIQIICGADGRDVGYVGLMVSPYVPQVLCFAYVVDDTTSYLETWADVFRGIHQIAETYYAENSPDMPKYMRFDNGINETVHVIVDALTHSKVRPTTYAWYLRVPDLSGFLKTIAPVLERRLKGSGANNYTGDFSIHLYDTTALTLKFEAGQLVDVTHERMLPEWNANVGFPYHSFLSVLFGHRSLEDLRLAYPEIHTNLTGRVLLNVLFPKKHSWIMAYA